MGKKLLPILALFLSCAKQDVPELIIVSPHVSEIKREFGLGFQEWYRVRAGKEARVRWLDIGATSEAIEYIKSRNDPRIKAGGVDVLFGGGDAPFYTLARLHLLKACPLPDSVLEKIPLELNGVALYSPDSLWYGAALSGFGILCNLKIASDNGFPVPRVWEDLADPRLSGWVALADPRYAGTLHVMMEIILQAYGWEKGWDIVLRMAGNAAGFQKYAPSPAKAVSSGQAAFGLCVDFYAFAEIDRFGRDRLCYVQPESLSIVTPDGIGMLQNGGQPALARDFIQYVMTEGQKLWMFRKGENGGPRYASLCRMSPDTTLYREPPSRLSVAANPFRISVSRAYDNRLTSRRWILMNDLLGAFMVANHRELRAGCKRAAGGKPTMISVPVTEKEAMALADNWAARENAPERIRLVNQWQKAALRQYREMLKEKE
jgi:ABC-type Fe3+ transport system substrate-binding protein